MDRSNDRLSNREAVELFGLLANETRMAAMRALWEADESLSFSAVARRGGIRDTGNFSYHLNRLQPAFVRKRDDRYTITRAGKVALTAVLAGRFTGQSTTPSVELDRACPLCGEPVSLTRDDDTLLVACSACPGVFRGRDGTTWLSKLWLPPAGERATPTETLDAAFQWTYSRNWAIALGTCPECSGQVEPRARGCPDHDRADGLCGVCDCRYGVLATQRCTTCHTTATNLPIVPLLTDDRVRSFFNTLGIYPMQFTMPAVGALFDYAETIHELDPVRFELRVQRGDDSLSMSANHRLELQSVTSRTNRSG